MSLLGIISELIDWLLGLVRDDHVGLFTEGEILDLTDCVALTDACATLIASTNLRAIRLSHCSRLTDTALEVFSSLIL